MIRYECEACGMTALGVLTPSIEDAWHDHMRIHHDETAFSCWGWSVVRLFPE